MLVKSLCVCRRLKSRLFKESVPWQPSQNQQGRRAFVDACPQPCQVRVASKDVLSLGPGSNVQYIYIFKISHTTEFA